ncbi:GH3 auxin-responsive promoter family protein [Elizabethkingia anophelis]|uniref:GH3 auxin-responsive promoter family protein n=1 Tax=Elizabethkingia anophelis TaxID=1117645 RepID=UPI0012B2FCA1|nr:GH3 auxin-responsive promoter family protein [Elizabethkingia anophelis]QGN22601.1 hypothetical protein GJV56_08135 [Elizabethkingia anophelis]QNV09251.1 hypothetical protein EIY88_08105 [Elizabethkingia anophelis]UTF91009.1 GH3 auxin-responsive promoter family protein [Elizabethkingia anophelis]UTG01879.1 GH3 auxin-responsive promoter family protein [Elizabethkingia anophelis]UTG05629.1 GH3 auxin-responsive promoter family protein [Elizabethkingia anophelis]
MLSILKKAVAKIWAKQYVKSSEKFTRNAVSNQENLLKNLITKAVNTKFGKKHGFGSIRNIQDFQSKVPLADYEDLKNYIEEIKEGEKDILWPGQPEYFAKTSGTTSGSKYIPISKEAMPYQIDAARSALFFYIAQKDNADFVNGKMIFLQGSPELTDLHGIKTGRLSGIVAHHIPNYLQKNRLPSWETNIIEDWETKVDKIIAETEKENMTLISGIPPWLIMYFEKLTEKSGKKIKELFPNLQLIVTGGVNYEPYREKMNTLLGDHVDIVQTFPASEGFFAYQNNYKEDGLLLLTNHGIFYEFIPQEDLGKEKPRRLTLGEIELHKDYALVITTNSGLWAYMIGDMVRFISNKPYKILVSGRTKHFTSAFGEHVIAYEVEEAMKEAILKHPAQISEFHLAPKVNPENGLPYHEWFIEFEKEPEDMDAFRQELDLALRNKNTYYNDLITGNILQPLIISRLKKDSFLEYAKSQGKLGGQNKIPRLANNRDIADFFHQSELNLIIQ